MTNLKSVILELLKDDENQKIAGTLMMLSPALLLSLNGSIEINFDDFNDISDHPVFAPAMANFNELYEGMMESHPDEVMAKRVTTEMIETEDPEEKAKFDKLKKAAECFNSIADTMGDLGDSFEIDLSFPIWCLSSRISLKSSGVGKVVSLLLMNKIGELLERQHGFVGADSD